MNITGLSVRRPTAIIVAVILYIGLGIYGYMSIGADLMPVTKIPVISVSTTYPGAGSQEIDKEIVKPVEDAISGIAGIDTMHCPKGIDSHNRQIGS